MAELKCPMCTSESLDALFTAS
ncbi:MAG: hypothetical protein H6Q89_5729, partial [Myxococcaceae bacterium]|nr:hypothetical protein [Myxococcaceae bacterium]